MVNLNKQILNFVQRYHIDNILIDEKPYKNVLVYNISYKTLIDAKPLLIRFNKIDGFIWVYNRTKFWYYLEVKNVVTFTTGWEY